MARRSGAPRKIALATTATALAVCATVVFLGPWPSAAPAPAMRGRVIRLEEETEITCNACKANMNKEQACKALYDGANQLETYEAATMLIQTAFWRPQECFSLDCMQTLDLPVFCKAELKKHQKKNSGLCYFFCDEKDDEEGNDEEKDTTSPSAAPSPSSSPSPSLSQGSDQEAEDVEDPSKDNGKAEDEVGKDKAAKESSEEEAGKKEAEDTPSPSPSPSPSQEGAEKEAENGDTPSPSPSPSQEGSEQEAEDVEDPSKDKGEAEDGGGKDEAAKESSEEDAGKKEAEDTPSPNPSPSPSQEGSEKEAEDEDTLSPSPSPSQEGAKKKAEAEDTPSPSPSPSQEDSEKEAEDMEDPSKDKGEDEDESGKDEAAEEGSEEEVAKKEAEEQVDLVKQMQSNQTKLAEAMACQGIGICEPCLRSSQCANNANNPKNYCCPKLKKCIDISSDETASCFGTVVCGTPRSRKRDGCSERRSQQPEYPMDCGEKCKGWDPLNWVKCGAKEGKGSSEKDSAKEVSETPKEVTGKEAEDAEAQEKAIESELQDLSKGTSKGGDESGEDEINCENCRGNIKKMQACQALFDGLAGNIEVPAAQELLKSAFRKPEECFSSVQCMSSFDLLQFCKAEIMEMQRNFGKCFKFCDEVEKQ